MKNNKEHDFAFAVSQFQCSGPFLVIYLTKKDISHGNPVVSRRLHQFHLLILSQFKFKYCVALQML